MNKISAHMPGPWEVEKTLDGLETTACGPIKVIYSRDRDAMRIEAEATARLIAAAPDMLLALRNMLLAFDVGQRATPTSAIGLARAAIEKSQGE